MTSRTVQPSIVPGFVSGTGTRLGGGSIGVDEPTPAVFCVFGNEIAFVVLTSAFNLLFSSSRAKSLDLTTEGVVGGSDTAERSDFAGCGVETEWPIGLSGRAVE